MHFLININRFLKIIFNFFFTIVSFQTFFGNFLNNLEKF